MSTVDFQRRGRVAHVTLNRPAVLNAMNLRMHEELATAWDEFERDDDLWVAVLSGAGDRAFSVGQDLKELAERNANGTAAPATFGSRGQPGWPRLTERFALAKPVVAKVNGYALGGGFELALACDVIIAAEGSRFGLPEARLGLVAGAGGVFRLTRQLPFRTALGHLITGRDLTADRAWHLGLVNEVVPADELDSTVDGWVTDILRCAPLAVRAAKEAAATSATLPLPQAFATRYVWEERRTRSADAAEGPRAFAEGRQPRWQGR
ncbi:enoyl-CoA-hydratase DpgD [Umezawaea tangerina]|uniref:(3,5-dihydroxycyclohex-3-enyl)acetyl-CoA dehydratase subunit D n=1 Tax=Umezawaea tangerina TaxID=84725 RepID=A0A2T0T6G5_9PSEU|nr:enoyl-CoA-hydratase DpgD [Umezawaea tangerina]PRY41277.1 (3,5-dihydroxycyclohex-3-enyl)acetyl-CoA dehydratase subunit D [Umezawaea tangerina]